MDADAVCLCSLRFSSVQLLGDLLFHVSGVTGKMTTETASEDDNFGTAQSNKVTVMSLWNRPQDSVWRPGFHYKTKIYPSLPVVSQETLCVNVCNIFPQAIIGALGAERRNRVLSGLYMGRSDIQLVVRQASLHVWKIVVSNTPRTLREILPTLFTLLLGFLASTCPDKRTVQSNDKLQSLFDSVACKRCICFLEICFHVNNMCVFSIIQSVPSFIVSYVYFLFYFFKFFLMLIIYLFFV